MTKNNINKIVIKNEIIFKIIFCISLPFLTFMLSERANSEELIVGVILSFLIGFIFCIKTFKDMFRDYDIKVLIASSIISLFVEKSFLLYVPNAKMRLAKFTLDFFNISINDNKIILFLVLLTLPALIEIIYIFIKKIGTKAIKGFNQMDRVGKKLILTVTLLGFIFTYILYGSSLVFFNPYALYDVIYTSDNGLLFNENVYMNFNMSENDIRQPLFGVFAMPFAVIAYILGELFFFIPNGYAIFLNTIQIFVLACTIYMITKMLNLDKNNKIMFLAFTFSTYPMIIFSFVMEQYIFAFFYLILTIYIYHFKLLKTNYAYVGAMGTLITSGILFPLTSKYDKFKNWIKNIFKCFIAFMVVAILTGQFTTIVNGFSSIGTLLNKFSGEKLEFLDKLKQFLYFVQSIFIAPRGRSLLYGGVIPLYHLYKVDFISVIGIIILVLCAISFIKNRTNKLSFISFLWIIFSFIILCLFGWGTQENGLILYSLYFSWAYLVLIYQLIGNLIKNKELKVIVIVSICVLLLCYNIPEFLRIVAFGVFYY